MCDVICEEEAKLWWILFIYSLRILVQACTVVKLLIDLFQRVIEKDDTIDSNREGTLVV